MRSSEKFLSVRRGEELHPPDQVISNAEIYAGILLNFSFSSCE
jgi:hypothetical protein